MLVNCVFPPRKSTIIYDNIMVRCKGPRAHTHHGDAAAATAEEYLDYIGSKGALFASSLIGAMRVYSTYCTYPAVRCGLEMAS